MVALLPDEQMRALGFTDRFDGFWFSSNCVEGDVWLDFTVNKITGRYDEFVSHAMIGQPEYYGRMIPKSRERYIARINKIVADMNAGGLAFKVDHRAYGVDE